MLVMLILHLMIVPIGGLAVKAADITEAFGGRA
jgi:hypothetical protein